MQLERKTMRNAAKIRLFCITNAKRVKSATINAFFSQKFTPWVKSYDGFFIDTMYCNWCTRSNEDLSVFRMSQSILILSLISKDSSFNFRLERLLLKISPKEIKKEDLEGPTFSNVKTICFDFIHWNTFKQWRNLIVILRSTWKDRSSICARIFFVCHRNWLFLFLKIHFFRWTIWIYWGNSTK